MSTAARITKPPASPPVVAGFDRPLRRIAVDEYHRMIDAGAFVGGPKCELIHGYILEKPVPNPPHAYAVDVLADLLRALAGPGRVVRTQQPVTLSDSEPEPDVVVAVGSRQDFRVRHPRPADVELVVEVADSSLREDQTTKLALYAGAKLPVYWIVNLIDRRVEVYAQPRGGKNPAYRTTATYGPGDSVPVVVGGTELGTLPVSELLP
jgi:Uma2 family endonuclease